LDEKAASQRELELEINGEPRIVGSPCTVADLLETLGLGGKRVAVAVDRQVVVGSRYGDVQLTSGNRIEILEAVGGG
jgi:sulfur carrier protein